VHRLRRLRGGLSRGRLFAEDQLPEEWSKYTQINLDYYKSKA
jgi:hypothetical protein